MQAQRTLVKSLPELWAELSDAETLGRHLGGFGEIRITRAERERSVAWAADDVSGTVELEPSGFGTKVTLTAVGPEPEPEPALEPAPIPPPPPAPAQRFELPPPPPSEPVQTSVPDHRPTLWRRILGFGLLPVEPLYETGWPDREHEPSWPDPEHDDEDDLEPEHEPELGDEEPSASAGERDRADLLTAVLDSLGAAHHRPFSRG